MKVSINHPHFDKDTEFSISGLAVIPNGGSVDLDDDTVALWETANEKTVADAFKDNDLVKVSGGGSSKPKEGGEG